jgi:carbon starvation protein
MNTLFAMIAGAAVIFVGYNYYARRIDRNVIQSDPKRATPATLYMDGVDFVPTSRNILYGYHFKSIAAAGPIVGAITAGFLWGWLPAMLWLFLGVMFIGWASDYSAIMVSVRNEGDSLSAIAHKLIAPRTRVVLLTFIFFYLALVAGAFGNLIAGVLASQPAVPIAIIVLALMGMLGGQMLYRWKVDLILATTITVLVTVLFILLGPAGNWTERVGDQTVAHYGPVSQLIVNVNSAVNSLTGNRPIAEFPDFSPVVQRIGEREGRISIMPSYIFWLLASCVFYYLGSILPIWRFAQPVNYIGFWITAATIILAALGAGLAVFFRPDVATFTLPAIKDPSLGFAVEAGKAWMPLWPMLFVTIACGAISGWHALIGSVGTARQLEKETDALPVGGGAMFTEMALGLLSLLAISVAGAGLGAARFASGIGKFLSVFGLPEAYGTQIGFVVFVVIVITVVQLVIRVARVSIAEAAGDRFPILRNPHVGILISLAVMCILVLSGTWVYLWQLFGSANQLMAALSMLIVTVWLISTRRNPAYIGLPGLFMYVTTIAAQVVIDYNLWTTVLVPNWGKPEAIVPVVGAILMLGVSLLIIAAALLIGYDGVKAMQRYRAAAPRAPKAAPAVGAAGAGD